MAATTYTYDIESDTLNGIVDLESIEEEIRQSSILTALDYTKTVSGSLYVIFKAALSSTDQTTLDTLISLHDGDPLSTTQELITKPNRDLPRGSGVRFTSPSITDMTSYFDVIPYTGRKLLMMVSRVTFHEDIVACAPIIFEVYRTLNLGLQGDPQPYIISQEYYKNIPRLKADAEEYHNYPNGETRLDFIWPQPDNANRIPTIIRSSLGEFVRFYITNDNMHSGVGQGPGGTYLYWEPVAGVRIYNPYNLATSLPSWPESVGDNNKIATVCFHCISYNENALIPGE